MKKLLFKRPVLLVAAIISPLLALGLQSVPAQASSTGTVVQGLATDAAGFVSNASVTLVAWPATENLAVGDTVPTDVVGTATTNASGSYSISITNWPAVLSDADSNSIVNLEVRALNTSLGESAIFSFPRQVVTQSDGSLALAVADPDGNLGSVDLTPQQANLSMTTYAPNPGTCGRETLVKGLGKKWVTVGAGFTRVSGPSMSDTYGKGQESSLGVGVQSPGGSWSASGTVDRSSSSSQDFGNPVSSSTYFRTLFTYGEFYVACYGDIARARWWDAGSALTDASAGQWAPSNSNNCVHEVPNASFTKQHSYQITFNAGVTISGDLGGLDLSAQTGWSGNEELTMKAPSSPAGGVYLCGRDDVPTGNAKKLEFNPYPL